MIGKKFPIFGYVPKNDKKKNFVHSYSVKIELKRPSLPFGNFLIIKSKIVKFGSKM